MPRVVFTQLRALGFRNFANEFVAQQMAWNAPAIHGRLQVHRMYTETQRVSDAHFFDLMLDCSLTMHHW